MPRRSIMPSGALPGLLCALLAQPVAAQTAADGTVSARWLQSDAIQTEAYFADMTLRAARGQWEATLGFFGVVGRLHESYADISYATDRTRVRVGFPRPAYDQVATSAFTRIMPRLALDSIGTSRSRATAGAMTQSDYLPYGGSVTVDRGELRYLASLQGVPDQDVTIAGAAVSAQAGAWQNGLAVEAVDQNGGLDWNTKAQASYGTADWRLGAGFYLPDANAQPREIEVFGSYAPARQVTLIMLARISRDADPLVALGADFAVAETVDFEIGLARASDSAVALEAGVAFNF